MAIDSRNKRASAMNPASPWRGLWPVADGTVDAQDRAQVAFMYRHDAFDELGDPTETYTPKPRGHVFTTEKRGTVYQAKPRGTVFKAEDR